MKRLISFPLEAGGNVLIEVEEGESPLTRGLHPSEVIGPECFLRACDLH